MPMQQRPKLLPKPVPSPPMNEKIAHLPKLALSLLQLLCEMMDPSCVLALTATCRTLHACDCLPINFCNGIGSRNQFFMSAPQFIRFAKKSSKRLGITGVTLQRCSDEDLVKILEETPRLHSLQISSTYLTNLNMLKPCQSRLRLLVLQNANSLLDAGALLGSTQLHTLKITWSCCLSALPDLSTCVNLREIDLYQCQEVMCIKSMQHCRKLKRVSIACLGKITDISALQELDQLEDLDMSWCEQLEDITAITNCTALKRLNLCHCAQLKSISALSKLHKLKTLNMAQCCRLRNLLPLSECTSMEDLKLFACKSLSDLRPLACCGNLKYLDLSYCRSVVDVEPLTLCFELIKVNLTKSDGILNVAVLMRMKTVTVIR